MAYLSALLEKRHDADRSVRMKSIQDFFKNAVSVVPIESLFYAMGESSLNVMLDCCEIVSAGNIDLKTLAVSGFLMKPLKIAFFRIRHGLSCMKALPSDVSFEEKYNFFVNRFYKTPTSCKSPTWKRNRLIFFAQENTELRPNPMLRWGDIKYLLNKTNALLVSLLHEDVPRPRFGGSAKRTTFPACETDLQVIYPSSDKFGESKTKIRCSKAPITLLVDGKERLQQLSEKLNVESSFCNANNEMLNVLDDLLIEFETCNALLGEFMQSQVHIPLEQAGNDKYVDEFARHYANSRGLSVWALLIVPFNYLQQMVRSSGRFGKIVIEFSRRINDFREYIFPSEELEFPDYDEKLNFLVGSMKKGVTCNKSYISYSPERQLERQCKKRNIFHNTPIENILQQWNANFEEETLTLVPYEYRPLIARWIRWSLMINYLRESLAKQCAVGVVGLVNSGKSKFVSSMFEVQVRTSVTFSEIKYAS